MQFLRNNGKEVTLSAGNIIIEGIDQDADGQLIPESPSIVLSHSPLSFDSVDKDLDVLILSGDTHGGQVPSPALFWRLFGYEKMVKYSHGLYREGRKMMYVSRGIGTSHIPIRIFRKPEVVVLYF